MAAKLFGPCLRCKELGKYPWFDFFESFERLAVRRNAQWSGIVLFLQNMVSTGGLAWVRLRVNTLSARRGLYRLTW